MSCREDAPWYRDRLGGEHVLVETRRRFRAVVSGAGLSSAARTVDVPGFELEGQLGRGGFGQVYRARRAADGLPAAVKVALPGDQASRSLLHERALLEAVGPPVAPAVLAGGTLHDDRGWVALELISWPALAAICDAAPERRLAVGEAIAIFTPIVRVVADLHGRGVIHGDLKQDNLFVAPDWTAARLIDFGVARRAAEPWRSEDQAARRGTAACMAPELWQVGGAISPALDIYALGVLLYQLLTGRSPFEGSAAEMRQAHLAQRPPPFAGSLAVPLAIADLVRCCLAKDPAERPYAHGLAVRLGALAASGTLTGGWSPIRPDAAPLSPAPAASSVRRMGLLAFEPRCDAARLQHLVQAMGGRIGYAAHDRTIALFDSEASHAPFGRLVRAAQTLAYERALTRGIAGVVDITVHQRRGREALLSPAFTDPSFDPARVPECWLGILPAAEHLLGDVRLAPAAAGELPGVPLDDQFFHTTSISVTAHEEGLIGLDSMAQTLLDGCRAAILDRRAALHLVLGEPGVGKSFLAGALASRLPRALPDVPVLAFRAAENLLGDPFELSAEMLRVLLDLPREAPPDGGAELLQRRLHADTWPAVAVALGWLDPTSPAVARRIAPGALRTLVASTLAEALLEQSRERGLVVLLDDVQRADDVILDAIDAIVLPERNAQLAVIALGRGLPDGRGPWGRRAATFSLRELAPLPPRDASLLVRRLLLPVVHVPEDAISHIVDRARGVPRLLIEIVRGLRGDGLVQVEPGTNRPVLALDRLAEEKGGSIVEWAAEREVRALAAPLRGHAQLTALLGGAFAPDEVAGVIEILDGEGLGAHAPLDARVGLERLVAAGLLVAVERGRLDFRYPLLRDAIARAAPAPLRGAVHEAAYKHHAAHATQADPWRLARLAHHAEHSSDPRRAIEPLMALGREASARHLYLAANTHLSRALALLGGDHPRRAVALHDRGAMRYRLGRYAEALDDLRAARDAAESPLEQADLLLEEAMALDWMVDYTRSREAAARADRLLADVDAVPPVLALRLLVARGRTAVRLGDLDGAGSILRQAHLLGETLGDDAYESRVVTLLMLAPILAMIGQQAEASDLFARARALCEARHDRMHLIAVVQNEVTLHIARMDHAGAVAAVDQARALSRELGLVASEYRQLQNLTELHLQAGRGADALLEAERTAKMATLLGGDQQPPELALLFGRAYMLEGQLEAAARALVPLRESASAVTGLSLAEQLLVRAIQLATSPYDRAAWAVVASETDALAGQSDTLEVFDLMVRAAFRAGDVEAAAAAQARFDAGAASTPGLYLLRRARQQEA